MTITPENVEAFREQFRRESDASANDTPEDVLRESQRIESQTPMVLSAAYLRRYAALLAEVVAMRSSGSWHREDVIDRLESRAEKAEAERDGIAEAARALLHADQRDREADEDNEAQCRERRDRLWQARDALRAILCPK